MVQMSYKPNCIDDINYWTDTYISKKSYSCIGSKTVDRYLKVKEGDLAVIWKCIELMNGDNSIAQIQEAILNEGKVEINVLQLCRRLASCGLLKDIEPDGTSSEISVLGVNILKYRFGDIPSWMGEILKKLWVILLLLSFAIFITAAVMIVIKWDTFLCIVGHSYIYNESYLIGAILVFVFTTISIVFHELAHWLTAIKFGLQPSELNIVLYTGIFPVYYVKIRGMYTIPVKNRVLISAAGIYVNLVLILSVIIFILTTNMEKQYVEIFTKIILSNLYHLLFALSPFKLTDGYFIMSWITGVTNIRIRMLNYIKSLLRGDKKKIDKSLTVYMLFCLAFIIWGIYSIVIWNMHIMQEIVQDTMLKSIVLMRIIPFMVMPVTVCIFFARFKRFVKS